ncbi:MAG TPA: DUF4136 domain-containing protein [Gammaproteobacteria bacterium]|nr:DUF4136 domain-containing protein [Gammaproteobacteria bacterium]
MKNLRQLGMAVLPACVLLLVFGCSQQRPAPEQGSVKALPFSVVATGDSGVDLRHAATFAWAAGMTSDQSAQSPEDQRIDKLLQEAISAVLEGKGYRYSAVPGESDLIVSYQVAMDEPGAAHEPPQAYGDMLQPSLHLVSPDPGRYEKGTLSIEVIDRLTGRSAWRSALQGFANLELSDTERRQRIGLMVDRMLAGVPAK